MSWIIEQNTTGHWPIGPFLSTAGVPLTTLAGDLAPVIFKNGAASVARNSTVAIVHDGGGMYRVPHSVTDSNTIGPGLLYDGFSTGDIYSPAQREFQIVGPVRHSELWSTGSTMEDSFADALLDRANAIETNITVRGALRIIGAGIAGQSSGFNSTTADFQSMDNSTVATKSRITGAYDSFGNRSSVVLTST